MPHSDAALGGRDWIEYYNANTGKPPRDTLLKALDLFEQQDREDRGREPRPRLAVDLGCGEGRDTREILRRGAAGELTRWRVFACDGHAEAVARTRDSLPASDRPRAIVRECLLDDMPRAFPDGVPMPQIDGHPDRLAPRVDLVNASFVLPFVRPERFMHVWGCLRGLLTGGGRFAGQFFGPRDSWASLPGRSHHSRDQLMDLLSGLELEHFIEDEKDGTDSVGNAKHWQVFHVVARRP